MQNQFTTTLHNYQKADRYKKKCTALTVMGKYGK